MMKSILSLVLIFGSIQAYAVSSDDMSRISCTFKGTVVSIQDAQGEEVSGVSDFSVGDVGTAEWITYSLPLNWR